MERHTAGRERHAPVRTDTAQGRPPTGAEAQARRRRDGPHGHPGVPLLVWAEVRNGLPFRPYVYRGTDVEEEAS